MKKKISKQKSKKEKVIFQNPIKNLQQQLFVWIACLCFTCFVHVLCTIDPLESVETRKQQEIPSLV